MIEFFKCLGTGLGVFAGVGVLLLLMHLASQSWPNVFPWVMSGAFAFGMALWFGATIRGDF